MSATARLAARNASARSGRGTHGMYCTAPGIAVRPAARAESCSAATAFAAKPAPHMLDTIMPSAISPAAFTALSPRAAMNTGMSARAR